MVLGFMKTLLFKLFNSTNMSIKIKNYLLKLFLNFSLQGHILIEFGSKEYLNLTIFCIFMIQNFEKHMYLYKEKQD